MEKKSYVPKATKYILKEDGLKQGNYYPLINCKWCNKELSDSQVYQFIIGKSKGTACSIKCGSLLHSYPNKELYIEPIGNRKAFKHTCKICKNEFINVTKNSIACSRKCANVLSSVRMTNNNPMVKDETRKKVSETLKKINHKPIIQGGNGRGATIQQLSLYNELIKTDNSFQMEYIEKTGKYAKQFNSPNHYKIDIASNIHMIAIEVDGNSHKVKKIIECDKRKTQILTLKGWKVLRLSNLQIQKELTNCVKMVLSMI
jgi:hypothetical protein